MDQVDEIAIESLAQLSEIGVGQKIPVLVCEDGTSLCESLIVTRYLNDLADGALMPGENADLMRALELESVASVLMDSHFVRSSEKYRREKVHQSADILERERIRAGRCYERLNVLVASESDRVTLATIAVISALDYANWRHPEDDWRRNHDSLSAYYDRLSARPSFAETAPNY
jgi:glutathione S-transferase